jgi:hypothetical protein
MRELFKHGYALQRPERIVSVRHQFSPVHAKPEDLIDRSNVLPPYSNRAFGRVAVLSHVAMLDMKFGVASVSAETKTREFDEIINPERSDEERSLSRLKDTRAWYQHEAERAEEEFQGDIENASDALIDLSDFSVKQLEAYMNTAASSFLKQVKTLAGYGVLPWRDWLVHGASQDHLLNVLQWHNHVVGEQHEDETIKQGIETNRQEVKQAVTKLVEDGLIVSDPDSIERISVWIGDVFDMHMKGQLGYHTLNTRNVFITQGVGKTLDERVAGLRGIIKEVLPHEFVHAAFDKANDAPDNPLAPSWLKESLTEKLSTLIRQYIALQNNDSTPIAPIGYPDEIMLLDTLLAGKDQSEATQEENQKAALKGFTGGYDLAVEFSKQLDKAWGRDKVISRVTGAIETMEQRLIGDTQASDYDSVYTPRIARLRAVTWAKSVLVYNPELILQDIGVTENKIAAMPTSD